jgi:acetamidase/formamidase
MIFSDEGKVYLLPANSKTTHTGYYDNSLPPVLTIDSGDTVVFETMMLFDNQFMPGLTYEEQAAVRAPYGERKVGPHVLTGPVYINGAEPGDVLEVRIGKMIPRSYGINLSHPGRGALPEDFPKGHKKDFYLDWTKRQTVFKPGIVIPLRPFHGSMAVAPKEPGKVSSAPPGYYGGNLDCKELVEGTTLYLRVQVKGALFSVGDSHAAQGDGEVSITALETAFPEARLTFIVGKDMMKLERPMFETPSHWGTFGFHNDLDEAVKIALRDMIEFLVTTKKLSRFEAYSLCSIQGDLRCTQVVTRPKAIHLMMPKAIFKY